VTLIWPARVVHLRGRATSVSASAVSAWAFIYWAENGKVTLTYVCLEESVRRGLHSGPARTR
jgi:hypothetical protein